MQSYLGLAHRVNPRVQQGPDSALRSCDDQAGLDTKCIGVAKGVSQKCTHYWYLFVRAVCVSFIFCGLFRSQALFFYYATFHTVLLFFDETGILCRTE